MTKWIAARRARVALRHVETSSKFTGRTDEKIAQSKRARTGLLEAVGKPQWRKRWNTTYLWRCLFLIVVFVNDFCSSMSLPTGMLSLNSLFSGYIWYDVLLLLFIVFFRMGFSFLVTTSWIFEISLCENPINQSFISAFLLCLTFSSPLWFTKLTLMAVCFCTVLMFASAFSFWYTN